MIHHAAETARPVITLLIKNQEENKSNAYWKSTAHVPWSTNAPCGLCSTAISSAMMPVATPKLAEAKAIAFNARMDSQAYEGLEL